jgi:hypothetical protein
MAPRGRPPVTEDVLGGRISDYCTRYSVIPDKQTGLPPFPAGRRETPQHREWITILKARTRLRRRLGGLCRRCDQPAVTGTIFCNEHDPSATAATTSHALCFVCGDGVAVAKAVEHRRSPRSEPVWVHRPCRDFILLAQKAGSGVCGRLQQYLWPEEQAPRRAPRRPRAPRQ